MDIGRTKTSGNISIAVIVSGTAVTSVIVVVDSSECHVSLVVSVP